jgi:hypothetical protein
MGKIFENLFKIPPSQKVQIYLQSDLIAIKKSNFACIYMQNISQYDSGGRCGPWASCFNGLPPTLRKFYQKVTTCQCLQRRSRGVIKGTAAVLRQ